MHTVLFRAALAALALLFLSLPAGALLAQQAPNATPRHVASFPISLAPQQYHLVMEVFDFTQGEAIAGQTHGGDAFFTVLKGSVFRTDEAGTAGFGTGESFSVPGSRSYSVKNVGSADARVVRSLLLPLAAPSHVSTGDGATTATVTYEAEAGLGRQAGEFNWFHLLIDIPSPGAAPHHNHAGPGLVMTLEGVLEQQIGSHQETTGPGDAVVDTGDHIAHVVGEEPVLVWATFLIPPGIQAVLPIPAPSEAPATPIQPPSAGDGGLLPGASSAKGQSVITLLVACAVALIGYQIACRRLTNCKY